MTCAVCGAQIPGRGRTCSGTCRNRLWRSERAEYYRAQCDARLAAERIANRQKVVRCVRCGVYVCGRIDKSVRCAPCSRAVADAAWRLTGGGPTPSKHAWEVRNREYRNRQLARAKARRKEGLPVTRYGEPWTRGEDAVVSRDDITLTEMCYMTGRSYEAVSMRRRLLAKRAKVA